MAFCDFVVYYDSEKDTQEDLTKRILFSIIIKRLKSKKPVVMFIGGDSGEGKSFAALRLQELLLEVQGLILSDYLEVMNVCTPLQYPTKIDKLLFEKAYKKVNILCLHEAREVVKAKLWQSFLTQSIADINAMSRSIKRLCIIIISQFIRDITTDIRYTLNYYCMVRRPKNRKARLYINVLWKDDRDLEKPKLRKRKLSGYIITPDGKYRRFIPQYLEMNMPEKDIIERFDKMDTEAKVSIIKKKLDKLLKEMSVDLETGNNKVNAMVDWYLNNIENIQLIGKRYRGNWKIKKEAALMHDLSSHEIKQFEKQLNEKLKEKGYYGKAEEQLELSDDDLNSEEEG